MMTDFYRGPSVRITDEVFEARYPSYQSFAISELRYVYVVQGAPSRIAAGLAPVKVCSTALAGIAAAAAATGWPVFHHPSMSVAALAVLAASLIVSAASWRARVRPHQLWAIYRGGLVCLFETTDGITFGQVRRALLRVFEQIEDMS